MNWFKRRPPACAALTWSPNPDTVLVYSPYHGDLIGTLVRSDAREVVLARSRLAVNLNDPEYDVSDVLRRTAALPLSGIGLGPEIPGPVVLRDAVSVLRVPAGTYTSKLTRI